MLAPSIDYIAVLSLNFWTLRELGVLRAQTSAFGFRSLKIGFWISESYGFVQVFYPQSTTAQNLNERHVVPD